MRTLLPAPAVDTNVVSKGEDTAAGICTFSVYPQQ